MPDIVIGADTIVVSRIMHNVLYNVRCGAFVNFYCYVDRLLRARFWRSQWTKMMHTECCQGQSCLQCQWIEMKIKKD